MEVFLLQLFIFFTAAAIAVPFAKKLGLGSVLGYLIAGIIIGPFGLSLIGDVEEVMHFTEFGVVMMLFLVGLELKPSLLLKMKVPILGMGGLQVVLTSIVITGIAYLFLPWQQALAIGLTLSLSSTAIVLQTLREKSLMNSSAGRSIFSVLLFQDLAVIPMLALMPFLATLETHEGHSASALIDLSSLPGYLNFAAVLLSILLIFFVGKFLSRPIFRVIAKTQVREIFVATALGLVVGISLLMTIVGLSPALGAFLAGVVLADSEYRHELESDLEPFKGLLLGVFFISIGASLNFTLISEKIIMIAMMTLGLITVKWIILRLISLIFRLNRKDQSFFSLALAQGGEFAFVLFQFSKTNGILDINTIEPLISAVALSMFIAPFLFKLHEKLSVKKQDKQESESDEILNNERKVILAGFGRLGTDLGRFLISAGITPIILDHDASNVEILRKFGFEVYYGDVTRLDLLESAGASEAEMLIIAINKTDISKKLIELSKKHYPHLKLVANAYDRGSAYDLMDLGVSTIRRETLGSAIELGEDTLKLLGMHAFEAHRLARMFKKHEEITMSELYSKSREDLDGYISLYQQHMQNLEEVMTLDSLQSDVEDQAWTAIKPDM